MPKNQVRVAAPWNGKGLSPSQLVLLTRKFNKTGVTNSQFVTVVSHKFLKDANGLLLKTRTHEPGKTTPDRYYEQDILLPAKFVGQIYKSPFIVVSCGCANFMYTWEFALNKYGAADINYGNGEPPSTSNPSMSPALCKHLYKTMLYAKERGIKV